jgi:hypothetical protein
MSGPLIADVPVTLTLAGTVVPTSAKGVIVNITSTDSTAAAFLTAWPTGTDRPLASTSNPRPGVPVPNQAYLKLGAGGAIDVFTQLGQSDIVVDVFGYIE